jgi:hypothetical protein
MFISTLAWAVGSWAATRFDTPGGIVSEESNPMTRKRMQDDDDPKDAGDKRFRVPRDEQDEWREWRDERGRRGRKPVSKRQEGRRRDPDDLA